MCAVFFEKNKKGDDKDRKKPPLKKAVKEVAKNFGPNLKMWTQEQIDKFTSTPMLSAEHGNYEMIYKYVNLFFLFLSLFKTQDFT